MSKESPDVDDLPPGSRTKPMLGLVAALVVGMLAGYLPARQAAQQEPVEALR